MIIMSRMKDSSKYESAIIIMIMMSRMKGSSKYDNDGGGGEVGGE